MSLTDLSKKIKKFGYSHKKHYDLFTEIIGKLQPIAFLISVSLLLSVFFDSNKDSISGKYALFASLLFFLAYLGFVFYRISNYRLSFYWGLSLILIGVSLFYHSFGGVFAIIFSVEDKFITTLAVYVVSSMFILLTKYFLKSSNKNNLIYKISNPAFYIAGLLILIYLPFAVYLNLTPIPIFFAELLLILILFISLFNLDKRNFKSP